MNVSQAITERRSVKVYDPHHQMTQAEIDQLLSLAMLSPTAFNIQHWRFVVVTDIELRKKNSCCKLESSASHRRFFINCFGG